MGKADQLSSLLWLGFGAAVIYGSYQLGLGALSKPGTGFLTFWSGVFLCGLAVVVFLQGKKAKRSREERSLSQLWVGNEWPKPIFVVVSLLVYGLIFSHIGYLLSTSLLLLFLFKGIEPETWVRAIGGSLLAAIISYLVFGIWLQVQLPRGFLEKALF